MNLIFCGLGLIVISTQAFAWSDHAALTRELLKSSQSSGLNSQVQPEPLLAFLKDQNVSREWSQVFKEHDQAMLQLKLARYRAIPAQWIEALHESPNIAHWIKVARIHPSKAEGWNQEIFDQRPLSKRAIIETHVDEPDQGMDQALWNIPEYQFGSDPPYGAKTGLSSQAAFHMWFLNEPWILRLSAPELQEGLTPYRIDLFGRMALLAKKTGHAYWHARFSAWVLHYVQDLTQPYHARSFPGGSLWFFLKFAVSGDKDRIKRESTQLVENRHFIFEDTVAHLYSELTPLVSSEQRGIKPTGDKSKQSSGRSDSWISVLSDATRRVAERAPELDDEVVEIFGQRITGDPEYDLDSDPQYDALKILQQLSPDQQRRLLKSTAPFVEECERSTQFVLNTLGLHQ